MSGSGKGGDNRGHRRKPFKNRNRDNAQSRNRDSSKNEKKSFDFSPLGEGKPEKKRVALYDRPKWVPPPPPSVPMPTASCAWCGKPIKDISAAICEPDTGNPVHFDCIINRIIEKENLESGDTVGYIGGGRFGIIHFNNPPDTRDFKIKKIFEWENRETRAEWRVTISDHFSGT
ncbi:MAG: hypothetical protein LBI06_00650 [Treponema sp.]|jgi:hypothetical protein|nr:hypothetical protein [Treponema sp.]